MLFSVALKEEKGVPENCRFAIIRLYRLKTIVSKGPFSHKIHDSKILILPGISFTDISCFRAEFWRKENWD